MPLTSSKPVGELDLILTLQRRLICIVQAKDEGLALVNADKAIKVAFQLLMAILKCCAEIFQPLL